MKGRKKEETHPRSSHLSLISAFSANHIARARYPFSLISRVREKVMHLITAGRHPRTSRQINCNARFSLVP